MQTLPSSRQKSGLPNPFRTYSAFVYPRNFKDVLVWAEYLWERNPAYRTSIQKVVSYFLAGVTVTQSSGADAVDTDAINSFEELLTDTYDVMQLLLGFGEELAGMGNAFLSCEWLFSRELLCPNPGCGWQMHLKALRKKRDYDWDGKDFVGKCPHCGRQVKYLVKDVKAVAPDGRKLRFVFRSAEDMLVQYNRLTDTYKFLYRIPADVLDGIRRGDVVYLEDSPKVFIDAAVAGEELVEFPEDMFFHARTTTLASFDKMYRGWGMPLFMVGFDNMVRLQFLNKFNEAITTTTIAPTHIISPQPQNLQAGVDPNRMPLSGAQFRSYMLGAFKGIRSNPTQLIVSPVPVTDQRVGGDADVIPAELLEYEKTQLLADLGIPQEFKQTTFQVVAPTMGLRMFERQWMPFTRPIDKCLRWMTDLIARAHQFEDMSCRLDTTSFVEDDMNKQVQLNLMSSNIIARTPVLKRYGIDFDEDAKLKIKEQQIEADAAVEQQNDQENTEMVDSVMPPAGSVGVGQAQMNIDMMQQQAQGGGEGAPAQPGMPAQPGAPVGGMPPMPFSQGNSPSAGIEQLFQQAQEMAQQLYSAPPAARRAQLVNLKATNPQLHAQVTQLLEDMKQQVAADAVQQSQAPQ